MVKNNRRFMFTNQRLINNYGTISSSMRDFSSLSINIPSKYSFNNNSDNIINSFPQSCAQNHMSRF